MLRQISTLLLVAACIQPSYQICHNHICDSNKCPDGPDSVPCPPGYECDKVCGYCQPIPGYCAGNNMCDNWNGICDIANNPYTTCFYCDADHTCKPGCSTDANCEAGYVCNNNHLCVDDNSCSSDADCGNGICDVQNAPDYTTCFYCDGDCKPGCATTDNCPSGYTCNQHHCEAKPGKVLLNSITIKTDSCTGCTSEGVTAILYGEKVPDFPEGLPCETNVLDRAGSTEFGAGGSAKFDGTLNGSPNDVEEGMMKGCFHAALNNQLIGGELKWVGAGTWSPLKVCVDWKDDVFANECDLTNVGGKWNLVSCNEIAPATKCS